MPIYQGNEYALCMRGVSVGDVGFANFEASETFLERKDGGFHCSARASRPPFALGPKGRISAH
jgi:hypothetical protein